MSVRETSREAYEKVIASGLITGQRLRVFNALFEHGPATASELFRAMQGSTSMVNSNVRARIGELRDMGAVAEIAFRPCSVTGMTCIVWEVSGVLPRALKKQPTKAELEASMRAALTIARGALECYADNRRAVPGPRVAQEALKRIEALVGAPQSELF